MNTICFGPSNLATTLPGLDLALTMLALEQPVTLIFSDVVFKAYDKFENSVTDAEGDTEGIELTKKMKLLSEFQTMETANFRIYYRPSATRTSTSSSAQTPFQSHSQKRDQERDQERKDQKGNNQERKQDPTWDSLSIISAEEMRSIMLESRAVFNF